MREKSLYLFILVMSLSIGLHLLRQRLHESIPYRRIAIPQDKISWSVEWREYNPPEDTSPKILDDQPAWADAELTPGQSVGVPKWNSLDGPVDRVSFLGPYQLDKDGYPLNPVGRTGIK